MSNALKSRTSLKILALAGLVAALVAVVLVDTGVAAPCQSNVQEFYSQAGCVNQVGTRWVNCSAPYITQQGQTNTPYRITTYEDCCGSCGSCQDSGTTYYVCG